MDNGRKEALRRVFIVFIKLICLVYLVFLIPNIVRFYSSTTSGVPERNLRVLLGIENLFYSGQQYRHIKSLRFAFICDGKSVDQLGRKTAYLLRENEFCVKKVVHKIDYKKELAALGVAHETFDAFMLDIQDGGLLEKDTKRLLKDVLRFAVQYKKKVVVLDRPNPLGRSIEGPGSIPWRHGLTVGELTHYINQYVVKERADLLVVPLLRWKRTHSMKLCRDKMLCGDFDSRFFSGCLQPIKFFGPLKMSGTKYGAGQLLLFDEVQRLSRWEMRYLKRLCWHLGLHCVDCSGLELDSTTKKRLME